MTAQVSVARPADSHPMLARAVAASVIPAAALLYFAVRHLTQGHRSVADRNARAVQEVERWLGLRQEARLQDMVSSHPSLVTFFDDVYIYGHWPVIAAGMLWLLFRHPAQFEVARNALLLSGGVALVIFALFPVTPPRLADPAMIDTVTAHSHAYRVLQPPAFTDNYAAMPSLHCGWDLIVGLSVARVFGTGWRATAARFAPLVMVAAVIFTANHYVLDAVVGDALAGGALWFVSRRRTAVGYSRVRAGLRRHRDAVISPPAIHRAA